MVNFKFWKSKEDKKIEKEENKKDEIVVFQANEIKKMEDRYLDLQHDMNITKHENIKLKEEFANLKNLNNVLIDSYWNPQKESELAGMLGMNGTPQEYKERVRDNHIPDYSKNPNPIEVNPALPKDLTDESAKGRVEEMPEQVKTTPSTATVVVEVPKDENLNVTKIIKDLNKATEEVAEKVAKDL